MSDAPLPFSGAARVVRTGLAVVHEGELVMPAAGSEAQAERVLDDSAANVTYYFPVEVEVLDVVERVDTEAIIRETLTRLAHGLGNL